jgi:hypothetical protein
MMLQKLSKLEVVITTDGEYRTLILYGAWEEVYYFQNHEVSEIMKQ